MNLSRQNILIIATGVFAGLNLLAGWQVFNAPVRPKLLLASFFALGVLSVLGMAYIAYSPSWQKKLLISIEKWTQQLLIIALIGLSTGWILSSLTAEAQSGWPLALNPAFSWLGLLSTLVIITLTTLSTSKNSGNPGVVLTGAIFVLFLLFAGIIATSGIGLKRVGYYWYAPGTPLLAGQVLTALFIGGMLAIFLKSRWGQKILLARLDKILAIILFILTMITWLNEPLSQPVNFLPAKLPPNYEIYPDSDSAYVDINAQRLLAGQSLSVDPADKPTYSFFLYILHLLANQDFETLINLQVIALAFIPSLFYLFFVIGFDNRPAGLAASLLFILRELNSIRLSNIILVSHPKLLLSDLPSAGLMILLSLLLIGWMRNPTHQKSWLIWAGIIFAALLLLRTQVVILVPLIVAFVWFALRHKLRWKLAEAAVLAMLGFAAFSLPWAIYGLDAPASANASAYTRQLAIQFQFDPLNHNVRPLAGESEAEFNIRMRNQVVEFIRENPGYTLKAISSYFFRNLIQGFLYLPASFRLETDLDAYTSRLPYWNDWTGGLPVESWGILALNLLLISSGLAAAWRKLGPIGLFPFAIYLGYLASLAIPMISGWRFLLPADWIVLVYYLLGGSALVGFLWERLTPGQQTAHNLKNTEATPPNLPWKKMTLPIILAILFSTSLFLAEALTPERYPLHAQPQQMDAYLSVRQTYHNAPTIAILAGFLEQSDAVLLHGKALYPRFFEPKKGFSRNGLISFRPYEFARLGFYLLGPNPEHIILPLTVSPETFPHAAEVWVLGCKRDTDYFHRIYVEALEILLPEESLIFQQEHLALACQE